MRNPKSVQQAPSYSPAIPTYHQTFNKATDPIDRHPNQPHTKHKTKEDNQIIDWAA
ncbi:hypothetical protein BDV41DRAFT_423476 [Aspergillus transmontanensis]|uniref:Uncharacterized protein n=1 Tax=Aspergillus transmontanensis TaxID=1034304 RepID=A0A5N6VMM5_9EURO|nr:hypothetical protein BDV41DRAFT_423476 [Aspergillus transmontanensis]